MRKLFALLLLTVFFISCDGGYKYPDIGKVNRFDIYTNFGTLELNRESLTINTNSYEQIVVTAQKKSTFDNYFFVAKSNNRIGSEFIYKLPKTEFERNQEIIFTIPKFTIELLEDKKTEVTYQIIDGSNIILSHKFIAK